MPSAVRIERYEVPAEAKMKEWFGSKEPSVEDVVSAIEKPNLEQLEAELERLKEELDKETEIAGDENNAQNYHYVEILKEKIEKLEDAIILAQANASETKPVNNERSDKKPPKSLFKNIEDIKNTDNINPNLLNVNLSNYISPRAKKVISKVSKNGNIEDLITQISRESKLSFNIIEKMLLNANSTNDKNKLQELIKAGKLEIYEKFNPSAKTLSIEDKIKSEKIEGENIYDFIRKDAVEILGLKSGDKVSNEQIDKILNDIAIANNFKDMNQLKTQLAKGVNAGGVDLFSCMSNYYSSLVNSDIDKKLSQREYEKFQREGYRGLSFAEKKLAQLLYGKDKDFKDIRIFESKENDYASTTKPSLLGFEIREGKIIPDGSTMLPAYMLNEDGSLYMNVNTDYKTMQGANYMKTLLHEVFHTIQYKTYPSDRIAKENSDNNEYDIGKESSKFQVNPYENDASKKFQSMNFDAQAEFPAKKYLYSLYNTRNGNGYDEIAKEAKNLYREKYLKVKEFENNW